MNDIVFATNNKHKLAEVRQILADRFNVLSLEDIGCHEDIPETADTIEGNALQKARYIKEHYGYDCFADDTGLEVRALGGAPGIYSARYAHMADPAIASHDSAANIRRLLTELKSEDDRYAQFRTAIALIVNSYEEIFNGIVEGDITHTLHGADGFGYDPVFRPEGRPVTFAEMSADDKNAISHRGRAIQKMVAWLAEHANEIFCGTR